MSKYNAWIIIGMSLATAAMIFYWIFSIDAAMTSVTGVPVIFMGLLLLTVIVTVTGWVNPSVASLLLLFTGVMLSTYNGVNASREDFVPSLLIGTPFVLSALLVFIGEKIKSASIPDAELETDETKRI